MKDEGRVGNMQSVNISLVMARDHDKIKKLLNDFDKCTTLDKETLKKAFEIFKWELEKHLFTEEKVIFTLYKPEDYEEGYKMVPQLIRDHDNIYKQLKIIDKSINLEKQCNFQELKEIITKHKNFEDEHVYPIFDQELDKTTKEMMIKRIQEIELSDNSLNKLKVKCSECGKKIGILKSYYSLKLKRRWIFCSECYDKIERKEK